MIFNKQKTSKIYKYKYIYIYIHTHTNPNKQKKPTDQKLKSYTLFIHSI